MLITKDMVGNKVTYKTSNKWWVEILYVGKTSFFGEDESGIQGLFYSDDCKWELVEEKVSYAPALWKDYSGQLYITGDLYSSEKEAKKAFKEELIMWPAPLPNSKGFYEI